MKWWQTFTLSCFFVLLQPVWGFTAQHWNVDAQKTSITFLGQSTLHAFNGEALQISGYIDSAVEKNSMQGRLDVASEKLDTQNVKRDRNMKKMLNVERYPEIVFRIDSTEKLTDKENVRRLKGELSIAEESHEIYVDAQESIEDDSLRLKGSFQVSLAQFKLRPPSVMGVIRVSDKVKVNFDVVFVKDKNSQEKQ